MKIHWHRRGRSLCGLAGVLAFAAALALATQAAQADEKVILGLVTQPNLTYAPHYMAKGAGYFKEEGLDVDIVPFDGSSTLVPQLAAKRILIGWASPDILILTHQPGKDPLPLRFFYNGSRVPPWEFVVPEASPVKTLADLRGKKIGVGSLSFGNVPVTKAILHELGMENGKDYELVPVGAGAAAFLALNRGLVDCLNLFDAAHANLEATGVKLRRLAQPAKFTNLTAHGFVTHEDNIKSQPKVLIGFGRAFAKATVACEAAPKQCVENFWRMFPNLKPTEGSEEKKLADAIAVLRYGMKKYLVFEGPRRYGSYTDAGLRNAVEALYAGGQIATDKVDIASLYTNQFVDDFNRFDAAAVAADAAKRP